MRPVDGRGEPCGGHWLRAEIAEGGVGLFRTLGEDGAMEDPAVRDSAVGRHGLNVTVLHRPGVVKDGVRVRVGSEELAAMEKSGVQRTREVLTAALDVEEARHEEWGLVVAVDGSARGEGDHKRVSYAQQKM